MIAIDLVFKSCLYFPDMVFQFFKHLFLQRHIFFFYRDSGGIEYYLNVNES